MAATGVSASLAGSAGGRSDIDEWLAAVQSHEPGHVDEATKEVGNWSRDKLWRRVLPGIKNAVRPAARVGVLKRGAMLHADIAMIQVLTGEPFASDWSRDFSPSAAGTYRISYIDNLETARVLLSWIEPDPRQDDDVRLWYRAVTAWLFSRGLLNALVPHLNAADDLLDADPEVAFDTGTLQEVFATPSAQQLGVRGQTSIRIFSARDHMNQAARHFVRVLELNPAMVEARVRLGHAYSALGRHESAVEELGRALADADDPVVRYYALLFLGRAHESLGDDAAALQAYRGAASTSTHAQSALLSISRLSEASGDLPAARAATERVLDLPADDPARVDPWWVYHLGIGRDSAALVADLQARVAALPREAGSVVAAPTAPGPTGR